MRTIKSSIKFSIALFLCAVAGAQTWDTSGNGLLQGNYYFREVVWIVGDNSGDLSRAISLYGNISFDGNGNYTLSGATIYDSSAGAQASLTGTGTYTISASGYGSLSGLVSGAGPVYGLVSNGIFVASTTENGYNDLFIAAKVASPAPTSSSFQGAYTMMDVDLSGGMPAYTFDAQFQLNPDGNGNIGAVNIGAYLCSNGCGTLNQSNSGVKYIFSNGAANVNFQGNPNSSLIFGQKYLYFSADGNFVFGGDPLAWDMFVGVRSASTAPSFGGLYYQAGVYQDESELVASGVGDLDTYYGSFKANNGALLAHQRLLSVFNTNPIDFTYYDTYSLNSNGTQDDGGYHYVFGEGGAIRIGVGISDLLGINVAVQAPGFPATGSVYINPTGVVNAASSAPFTSGLAPGEFISIYGINLAPSTQSDSSFPTQVDGVQVLINNNPVPVYVVSANQISALVPFVTGSSVVSIQVVNNGVPSNTVTEYLNFTAPGAFTIPPGGIGYAAALHADSSLVSPSSPAQIGETIAVYVSGMGAVSPPIADGTPGPTNPFSLTTNTFTVLIGGISATVAYAGLAPELVGLYQINVQVPTGVPNGDNYLDIAGPDYYSSQALVTIGTASTAKARRGSPKLVRGLVPRRAPARRQ